MYKRHRTAESIRESLIFQELCRTLGYDELAERDHKYEQSKDPHPPFKIDTGTKYAWVGINPPAQRFKDMLELFEYAKAKLPYKTYDMVVEQHTENGIRPHLHLLIKVKDSERKNHVISLLARLFELEENFISVKLSTISTIIETWRKYLRGDKKLDKQENVGKDQLERERLGIPHLYSVRAENIKIEVNDHE